MNKVHRYGALSFLLAAVFALSGCALSPQEVELAPKVTIEKPAWPMNSTVSVTVYDERISNTLGYRGGVYGDTNAITTDNTLIQSLHTAVSNGLVSLGMKVAPLESVPRFRVYLDKLEYQVPEGGYTTKVDLAASIRVVAVNNYQRFEGSYASSISERVVSAPSDEKNEELINRVVSDVLTRAFEDVRLQKFLSQL